MSHENKEFPKVDRPLDFGTLRNRGVIMQWKNDIFGNEYALFKINSKVSGLGGIADPNFTGDGSGGSTGAAGGLLGLDEDSSSTNTNDVDSNDESTEDDIAIGFFTDDGCYVPGDANTCMILDGHIFNDPRAGGTNFDYSVIEDDYQNIYWELRGLDEDITTNRSGLTSRTVQTENDFLSAFECVTNGLSGARAAERDAAKTGLLGGDPYFILPCTETIAKPNGLPCIDIRLIPFQWCVDLFNQNIQSCTIKDGSTFTQSGLTGTPLTEFVSSDTDVWPSSGSYYYTFLQEGGLHTADPIQRPTDTLSADFTAQIPITSSNYKLLDADLFSLVCSDVGDSSGDDSSNQTDGDDGSGNNSSTTSGLTGDGELGFGRGPINSVFENKTKAGVLFFRNELTTEVSLASAALFNIYTKYPDEVQTELNTLIVNVELIYDLIFFETANYFVYDKVVYDTTTGEIEKPLSPRNFVDMTGDKSFHKLSNTFFLEDTNKVYYVEMKLLPELSATNQKIIYPTVYEVDVNKATTKQLYPNFDETSDNLRVYSLLDTIMDVNIVSIEKPVLTYNSRNQIFNVSYMAKDINNIPYIGTVEFKFENSVLVVQSANFFKTNLYTATSNFYTGGAKQIELIYGENLGTANNTAFSPTFSNLKGTLNFN